MEVLLRSSLGTRAMGTFFSLYLTTFVAGEMTIRNFVGLPGCSVNMAYGSDVMLVSGTTRSHLECYTLCSSNPKCISVNVCKELPALVTCEILTGRTHDCNDLSVRNSCRYKHIADYNPCLNGGTWNYYLPCICQPGWAGIFCQRRVRDCKEARTSGIKGEEYVIIQPIGCPYEFQVYCTIWGVAYIFRRNYPFGNPSKCADKTLDPTRPWDEWKVQFGSVDCDYFLGLEKTWYILRQGVYNVHFYNQYYDGLTLVKSNTYYWDFKMADEADDFAIQYAAVSNPTADGLSLGGGTKAAFCTSDRDCGGCVAQKNAAWWWREGDCGNYPITMASGSVTWPVNGNVETLSLSVMMTWPDSYHDDE